MNLFDEIADHVKRFLSADSSGHDFYHAQRVFNNAMALHKMEGQGDKIVIGTAAYVHDICRPWEKKTGKSHFGPEALEIIRDVLQETSLPKDKIEPVLEVVKDHDIYDWSSDIEKSVELKIVQDADNLDAIGAIGVGRTFAFGGANGLTMYHPGENLDFTKDFIEDPDHRTTTIAHFYEKLLKLKENMNTDNGKKLAEERHKFMEAFLLQFFDEWQGKA